MRVNSRRAWLRSIAAGGAAFGLSGLRQALAAGKVVNHTDAEPVLLESLVGRRPPFFPGKY